MTLAYHPDMQVGRLRADQFDTPFEWQHDSQLNVNPVIHARFTWSDGSSVEAFAKPFDVISERERVIALNEVTGWLLAKACGLPVAEKAFFAQIAAHELPAYNGTNPLPAPDKSGYLLCFCTQSISNTNARGIVPTEALVNEQAAWKHCDSTIGFDEFTANTDRHCNNLIRRGASDFVLIDHGYLLRRTVAPIPCWTSQELPSLVTSSLPNVMHGNTYIYAGRSSQAITQGGYEASSQFVGNSDSRIRSTFHEISYWCSKLLPGASAEWLNFLYSRSQPGVLSALLRKRFGVLHIA